MLSDSGSSPLFRGASNNIEDSSASATCNGYLAKLRLAEKNLIEGDPEFLVRDVSISLRVPRWLQKGRSSWCADDDRDNCTDENEVLISQTRTPADNIDKTKDDDDRMDFEICRTKEDDEGAWSKAAFVVHNETIHSIELAPVRGRGREEEEASRSPSSKNVVLWHGFGLGAGGCSGALRALSEQFPDHAVFACDWLGYGLSSRPSWLQK
ncbi:unnamed protein product, partial [Amoebophrya sp. A25]|eukprot:GSA25T00000605001.1